MFLCLVQNFRGEAYVPNLSMTPLCTWHACTCTHTHAHTHSSRAIYFPQDLRKEHNYRFSNSFHHIMLGLYCGDVVTAHTQPGKWPTRLRTASRAICASVAKPTMISSWAHGSRYVFAQAGMDVKVIFQELGSSDTYIYTHASATELSVERGTSCGLSQNWVFLEGKPAIGTVPWMVTAATLSTSICQAQY